MKDKGESFWLYYKLGLEINETVFIESRPFNSILSFDNYLPIVEIEIVD